ncbi:hypothetical protein D9619_009084 [Psilocybe cf. subviscida]|uniref:Uncharacterized protein n=1 Tax=Psilocybe cf. subviscida TaxID=2480587 RepID=A0A8H5FA81_9AGAR|nr:hypothetical protein D9619_009084 [Psilocybe cf. subviscida]
MSSKYPTSAGAYFWVYKLSSPKRRRLASWINGWLTLVGVWTISLSVTFGTAQILVAGIGIYHPDWVPQPWQTYLIFVAIAVFSVLVGVFFNAFLPTLDIICAIWTALGVVVILIALSVKAASGRHSAKFAFTHFDPSGSGWTPGWSFFIGLLPVAYTFSAIGMVNGGQPLGLLFELIMGSKGGGFGMWIIIFGIGIFCGISICCAASRATWSFARDKAVPFHSLWSKVNHRLDDVPVYANMLSLAVQLVLGLIFLGSSAAFNAFVGVAVMCLGASYAMPVAISLANGRKDMEDAPFNLGRWGFWINLWAVGWVAFSIVLFSMPAVIPVTKVTMMFVGFGAISAIWYMISGKYVYHGPPNPLEEGKEGETANTSSPAESFEAKAQ